MPREFALDIYYKHAIMACSFVEQVLYTMKQTERDLASRYEAVRPPRAVWRDQALSSSAFSY